MADATIGYCVEYARSGRSSCRKCEQKIQKGVGRIGKVIVNRFTDDETCVRSWYHMRCIFETFKVQHVR